MRFIATSLLPAEYYPIGYAYSDEAERRQGVLEPWHKVQGQEEEEGRSAMSESGGGEQNHLQGSAVTPAEGESKRFSPRTSHGK